MITYVRINDKAKLQRFLDRNIVFAVRFYVSDYASVEDLLAKAKRSSARGWNVFIVDDLENSSKSRFDGHVNAWHFDLG